MDARTRPGKAGPVGSHSPRGRFRWALLGAAGALAVTALVVAARARRAERAYPPRGRFVTINAVRLHYVLRADGRQHSRPVVLIHGNGSMVEDFAASGLLDRAGQHHHVIAFDRPGFGHSTRPRNRVWTMRAQAALLRAALDRLAIGAAAGERPILVGHSLGALVALAFALDHPDALAGLVLVSGYYFPSLRPEVPLFSPPALPVVGDVLRYTISPVLAALLAPRIVRRLFAPQPVPPRFNEIFPIDLAIRPSQLRATAEDAAVMVPSAAELSPHYARLRLPVVLIAGTEDRILAAARQATRLRDRLQDAEIRFVPGAGHMAHYQAPQVVLDAIDAIDLRARAASERPGAADIARAGDAATMH